MTNDLKANLVKNSAEKGLFYDPGRRFPIFTGAKGYDAMSFLNKEEKAVGAEMLWARWETPSHKPEEFAIQFRNPSYVFQSDPLLWQEEMRHYAVVTELVYGKTYDSETVVDSQDGKFHDQIQDPELALRYQLGQLMIAKIAQVLDVEWVLKLLGVAEPWGFLSKQKVALLHRPQSSVWSEDERLALEFTTAIIKMNMSDDLFARAQERWGEKQLLRFSKWIAAYVAWVMLTVIDIKDADKDGSIKDDSVVV